MNEQLAEKIWKWCGFKEINPDGDWDDWYAPDGRRFAGLPSLILDNLFKWAVPKLGLAEVMWLKEDDIYLASTSVDGKVPFHHTENTDPSLALAFAIEKVIDAEKEASHEQV